MIAKKNSLLGKLKLDKHHRMEQFGIIFCAFMLAFAFIFGTAVKTHLSNKKLNLTAQAKYTETAQFSLSQEKVNVVEVYRNNDCTKAFVLLEIADHNMANISTSANDYQILMTGYKQSKLTGGTPQGAIYMFGSDGYIGLYFSNPTGFDSQIYDIVLRNTKMMIAKPEANPDDFDDSSYAYHNQLHLYANFAGTDAPVAEFLNQEDFTLSEMYASVMSSRNQSAIKETLGTKLMDMNMDMLEIERRAEQLEQAGLIVPALPVCIAGDTISTDATVSASNPMYYDANMDSIAVSSSSQLTFIPEKDITSNEIDGSQLYFSTDYVFKGGIQYDFQPVGVYDPVNDIISGKPGIDSVFNLKSGAVYSEWKNFMAVQLAQRPNVIGTFSYYTQDGHLLTESELSAYSSYIPFFESAVQNYIADKYAYQTNLLVQLIDEKQSTENVTQRFTIRSDENTLIIY